MADPGRKKRFGRGGEKLLGQSYGLSLYSCGCGSKIGSPQTGWNPGGGNQGLKFLNSCGPIPDGFILTHTQIRADRADHRSLRIHPHNPPRFWFRFPCGMLPGPSGCKERIESSEKKTRKKRLETKPNQNQTKPKPRKKNTTTTRGNTSGCFCQNYTTRGQQVLVIVSIYQGAIFGYLLLTHCQVVIQTNHDMEGQCLPSWICRFSHLPVAQ